LHGPAACVFRLPGVDRGEVSVDGYGVFPRSATDQRCEGGADGSLVVLADDREERLRKREIQQ
jgi:hypothetical protein